MSAVLALGLFLVVALVAGESPASASASASGCSYVDSEWVDSNVSSASVWLNDCGYYYTITGTIYDDACDNRTAYLDLYGSNGQTFVASVGGCGNSKTYAFAFNDDLFYASVRTRACNTTCSSSDWGNVYTQ